ncbi:class I SAM-dependent methyltransferase [Croceitalea sp. MTPC9]|uniref:class I SAM-dependent methyltransferase n=1 Tax=unclassified Croceitalea TaxID=2632280 RepID=UPI002B3E098A|nr:class I SAM-dependent methyltransferase [Croceitalea sp. MTPC6]GMN16842.1 class I SAM-dependent methyltransferase [Croceitalea sp. MTPC9]
MKEDTNKVRKIKKPWPTKDAMEQIYEQKLWGDNHTQFYSGKGSHEPEIVNPYLKAVTSFLTSFKNPIIVCDLGCGDFNVGKQLVKHAEKYVAVDIVPELIAYNKENFRAENLEFHCLDVATTDLPPGDCALLRQVLQHLSNAEIQNIVSKLVNFKYVIVTEHLPNGDFIPNKDIISGQGIRLNKKSGVNLLAPPFNLKIKEKTVLSSVVLEDGKGVVDTSLYKT